MDSARDINAGLVGFERVLVPLDGTARAAAALPTALALADHFGAQVHAISVANDAKDTGRLRDAAGASLGSMIEDGRVAVLTDSDPSRAIAQHALDLGSCVVTMSTRSRARLGGALLGSTARSVMSSLGPIVAVGPNADRPGWTPPPPRWPAPLTARRIVACVDGSVESEAVLAVAAGWCRSLAMTLSILMFVDDGPEPLRPLQRTELQRKPRDASEYVQELAARWSEAVTSVDAAVIKEPVGPSSGLRLHLDTHPAGLVAVSTQARSGFQRLLRGSTADAMIRASTSPCLVVPPAPSRTRL